MQESDLAHGHSKIFIINITRTCNVTLTRIFASTYSTINTLHTCVCGKLHMRAFVTHSLSLALVCKLATEHARREGPLKVRNKAGIKSTLGYPATEHGKNVARHIFATDVVYILPCLSFSPRSVAG